MGYITNFEFFFCEGAQPQFDALMKDIDDFLDAGGDVINTRCYEGKWYSCEKDLADISKKHPDVGFGVAGQGEDPADRWTAWFQDGRWYMEDDDHSILSWEDAKCQMEHPSRVRRAIQRVDSAYDLLLEEVIRAVRDGKHLEMEDVFGFVYDDDDTNTVLQEMFITELKVTDGTLYARMVKPCEVIDGILEGHDIGGGEWYAVNRNLYGDFHATIYSIASSILD